MMINDNNFKEKQLNKTSKKKNILFKTDFEILYNSVDRNLMVCRHL